MTLQGRQARFMALTLTLWTLVRVAQCWPDTGAPATAAGDLPWAVPLARGTAGGEGGKPAPGFEPWRPIAAWRRNAAPDRSGAPIGAVSIAGLALFHALGSGNQLMPHVMLRRAVFASAAVAEEAPADAAPAPPVPPLPVASGTRDRRFALETYLYVRSGSGQAALSPDGQLGGSQAAARATWRVGTVGPVSVAAAARLYAPLASRGAEAAAGIDLAPASGLPLRVSIERRQRLDHAGRSAWSAYAAGGFYREPARRIVVDGYAQAGIVGVARGDLFVDGALRGGWQAGTGGLRPVLGAGLWGAAQPGVSRVDVGPRAAFRLPIVDHALSVAVEGRFQVAGRAQPRSGVALTLAAGL